MSAQSAVSMSLVPAEDEIAIREAVRGICNSFGERYARDCYERGEPPAAMWNALAKAGFVGANIPTEWGGGGLGMAGLCIVGEEAAASGGSTLMLVVSSAMAGSILARHATDAQKTRWLRGIAAGTTQLAFAITEPDAGSNSHQLRTELRREGSRYVLKGQKTFISGVESADAVLVVARMRDDTSGELGLPCLCIVDVDAPGFTRTPIPMPYLGPEKQWTLFFEDVAIEPDRLIGGEVGGLTAVFDALNPERIILAALINGVALRALDKAAAYARERAVWGVPIATHQAIAHPLAKAKIEVELARLMTQKAAALFDAQAKGAGEASNMAKYAAAEAANHAVDAAIQTHGGNGIALEYGISDLWWMARLLRIAPVSAEMILNYIAQHSLRLPKSY
ncbi:acyl-CoA/acyl-ACP dehydrogenase [Pendulispora rubella]|uniref:Acyl-CoA/acyl-ACP dehydrogenase n=1 Tax=Pendulispora rubella TaxID=2741070 RepID=A0ABZ2L568_9BACT